MENAIFKQLGLSDNQIEVYNALLTNGSSKAGNLTKKTSLKRGLVYKSLEELVELGLVTKQEKEVAIFEANHPNSLKDLADRKVDESVNAQKQLEDSLRSLISTYNLSSGKPGVEFYEGLDGVRKALDDTLKTKGEIYTYADIETIDKYISNINTPYVKKRLKLQIPKKLLVIDTPEAREVAQEESNNLTEFRLISNKDNPKFNSVLEIYENKIVYITFNEELLTATVINDPFIYEMHKYIFEVLWDKSKFVFK